MPALILTYHAIERGDGPLTLDPDTFATHLDCIVQSGAQVVTVSALVDSLRAGVLSPRAVAITFDDGIASVARVAAPLLAERGLVATMFCVAGHVGGRSDWSSARGETRSLELATASELAQLARQGFEIGCHGMTHAPITATDEQFLREEIVESRRMLEEIAGTKVRAFAYPYGAPPSDRARRLVETSYAAACSTSARCLRASSDPHALPRIDAHYVRSRERLLGTLSGRLEPYVAARRILSRARRMLVREYRQAGRVR